MHVPGPAWPLALAWLPVLLWSYLLLARGGFWRVPQHERAAPDVPGPGDASVPTTPQRVVAIIPARDEADLIGAAVASLLRQRFAGTLHIIVVDDHSTDGTAAAALAGTGDTDAARRVSVLTGASLPRGWTGKLWALAQGVEAAAAIQPDFLLFTDADIVHAPDSLATLCAHAARQRRDLVSWMALLTTETPAERCLLPAFVFFFFMIYPPAYVASPRRRTAAAAGGCVLLRPHALARAGGLDAIRYRIIDDCALARAIKSSGGSLWLGPTRQVRSLRRQGSWSQINHMISRTAFNQLQHSYVLLGVTMLGLAVTFLLAPALCLSGRWQLALPGTAGWLLMSVAYAPILRLYRQSRWWCLALPGIALLYGFATLHSALQYARGRGGEWKGRVQDVAADSTGAALNPVTTLTSSPDDTGLQK